MAFPTIPTAAAGRVLFANQADTSGTRTFPDLSSLTKNSGDLLVAICVGYQSAGTSGAVFSSWGASFTERADLMTTSGSTMCIGVATKVSTGSETGTFSVTQASPTGHASMALLSIPGGHRVTAIEAGTIANGTSAAADPASFNPGGWDVEDTLWIAVAASGMTSGTGSWTGTGTTAPANFTDRDDSNTTDNSAVGQTEVAVAFRQQAAASQDVGTAGVDTSNARNSAVVIAVRPANDQTVTPGVASLTTSTFAPKVNLVVIPPVASLATATFAPTAQIGTTVTPSLVALTLTTFEPTVTVEAGGVTVTPDTASLTTSSFAPTVSTPRLVTPAVASLTTQTFAPTAATPRLATPGVASLATNTFAPSVVTPRVVTPDVAALVTEGLAPTVTATDHQLVTPSTAVLSLSTFTPTVVATDPKLVTPGVASLSLTGFAPSIYSGTTVVTGAASLSLTTFAPSVTFTDNRLVTPAAATLALTSFAASVLAPRTVTPGTRALVITTFAPTITISTPGSVTVIPNVAALALTAYRPLVLSAFRGMRASIGSPSVLGTGITSTSVIHGDIEP